MDGFRDIYRFGDIYQGRVQGCLSRTGSGIFTKDVFRNIYQGLVQGYLSRTGSGILVYRSSQFKGMDTISGTVTLSKLFFPSKKESALKRKEFAPQILFF